MPDEQHRPVPLPPGDDRRPDRSSDGPETGARPTGRTPPTGAVLEVNATCRVPLSELEWRFGPSGGPGGQHANRAHTRAEVRFDAAGSPSLTQAQRARITSRFGPVVRASCDDQRSQSRNRAEALERLRKRLAAALTTRRARRTGGVSRAAKQRRLEAKRRQSERKQARRWRPGDD